MNYFTKEIMMPSDLDDFDCHTKMYYIGDQYLRITKFSKHDRSIQIDSMYLKGNRNIGGAEFPPFEFNILEGEELFDPEVYYMLP